MSLKSSGYEVIALSVVGGEIFFDMEVWNDVWEIALYSTVGLLAGNRAWLDTIRVVVLV